MLPVWWRWSLTIPSWSSRWIRVLGVTRHRRAIPDDALSHHGAPIECEDIPSDPDKELLGQPPRVAGAAGERQEDPLAARSVERLERGGSRPASQTLEETEPRAIQGESRRVGGQMSEDAPRNSRVQRSGVLVARNNAVRDRLEGRQRCGVQGTKSRGLGKGPSWPSQDDGGPQEDAKKSTTPGSQRARPPSCQEHMSFTGPAGTIRISITPGPTGGSACRAARRAGTCARVSGRGKKARTLLIRQAALSSCPGRRRACIACRDGF